MGSKQLNKADKVTTPDISTKPAGLVVKAGQVYRVPKKLAKEARHRPRLSALAVWATPGDKQVWLEIKHGGMLKVVDRAKQHRGKSWRKVVSPDGVVEGYVLECALLCCELVETPDKEKRIVKPKPIHIAPQLFDWAYVGVDAKHTRENIGQCIAIEYDRLPDPDHLGLATFRMLDGRSRQAWLLHAQKTEPFIETS